MANLKCHMPIMVNVEVYAMRFATGPGLCQGLLSFWVGVVGYHFGSVKKFALVIWLFYEIGFDKVEVSYAYNGQCSSICDAICDRTRCAPGTVFLGWG